MDTVSKDLESLAFMKYSRIFIEILLDKKITLNTDKLSGHFPQHLLKSLLIFYFALGKLLKLESRLLSQANSLGNLERLPQSCLRREASVDCI